MSWTSSSNTINLPSTPVAVITEGTTGRQQCVTGTLRDIVEKVKSEKPQSTLGGSHRGGREVSRESNVVW